MYKPKLEFIEGISGILLGIETDNCKICKLITKGLNINLESVFSAIHYGNFLNNYKEVSKEQSIRIASEIFGLPA